MWTKNADLDGIKDWADALTYCNDLDHGGHSDWRLPNVRELQSLVDYGQYEPALPTDHPFTGVQPCHYWSSTPLADDKNEAWLVGMAYSGVGYDHMANTHHVWPVRSGQ